MQFEQRTPCVSCPYRKDVRLGFWEASHFVKLLEDDRDPVKGALYLCHEGGKKPREAQGFCIGWLLQQRKKRIPSITLRLLLMKDDNGSAWAQLDEATSGGAELYPSLEEMCTANLRAIASMARRRRKRGPK